MKLTSGLLRRAAVGVTACFLKDATALEYLRSSSRRTFPASRRKGRSPLPEGRASFGKLHLWRETRFPKEAPEVPEGSNFFLKEARLSERSFTSGGFPKEAPEVPEGSNFFLNVLREASPLAAFRRKRTSFGKLHLWRLSEGSELVLKKARPSAYSRRKGVLRFLRLPSESFTSGGVAAFRRKRQSFNFFLNVLREASPLAAF